MYQHQFESRTSELVVLLLSCKVRGINWLGYAGV